VRLHLSLSDGLVVVVPRGFDVRRLPSLLTNKAEWIEKAWARLVARGVRAGPQPVPPSAGRELPEAIELAAVGESWSVTYQRTAAKSVTVRQGPGHRLLVSGHTGSKSAASAALRRWMLRKAHTDLEPWLERLAREGGYSYQRVAIRAPRTRWGSCSARGTISLSAKLLFLPPELAGYVLWHELCHTAQPNHSKAFWALLARHEPGWQARRKEMRTAGTFVPAWANVRGRKRG
jgi:hypothetical protein